MGFGFNPFTSTFDLTGNSTGKVSTYANLAAFPASALDGSVAVALDTDILYVFDDNSSTWKPLPSLVSGVIPLSQIPPAALERLVVVADQTSRYALTTATVQNGDSVYQTDTSTMYMVKDDTNLANSNGYQVYSAGTAVNFSGSLSGDVTGGQSSTAIAASTVTGKAITGFVSGSGTVTASDTILQAINKLDGNVVATTSVANAALPSSSFTDSAVTGKLLTGYSSSAGTVAATDTILQGINKLNGNAVNIKSTADAALPASSFTDSAVTGKLITGFSSGSGTVADTDTILQAINKLDGNVGTKLASSSFTDSAVTSKLITGFVSGAGTVAATDTILQAIDKLDGNTADKLPLSGGTLTGALVESVNGAASTPAISVTGTPYTAGTTTTNKPQVLIEPTGTTSASWNANGTMFGINAASGFTGLLADYQLAGTTKAYITNGGTVSGNALQTGQLFPASNNATLQVNLTRSYSTASTTAVAIANNSHTQSSGTNVAVSIIPTINSSSTAANTDLLINRTQTATGSGAQNLIDAQVGGTSKFKVDNTGIVTATTFTGALSGTATGNLAKSTGDIDQTSFSSSNNQVSAADVTSFAFSNASVRSFSALVSVYINATSPLYEVFELKGIQRASDWILSYSSSGDTSGLAFSITNAGQIQYTSTNVTGFTSGTVKFRAITTAV